MSDKTFTLLATLLVVGLLALSVAWIVQEDRYTQRNCLAKHGVYMHFAGCTQVHR